MEEYLGIRKIKAKPMTLGMYNDYRGWSIPANEDSNAKGFLVEYSDGLQSWSPENVFIEASIELRLNPLLETVELMKSSDFRDRFKAEYYQLKIRIKGLSQMVRGYKKNELTFKPKCSVEIFEKQLVLMENYAKILEERALIEGVELK